MTARLRATGRDALLALLMSVSLCAESQSTMTVKVVDPSGAIIPGARVEVSSSEHDVGTLASTNSQGEVVLHLEPATYTVHVSAPGFKSWRRTMIQLETKSSLELQAELPIGESHSGPVVSGERIVEVEPAESVSGISPEPLERLINLPRRRLPRHLRAHFVAD